MFKKAEVVMMDNGSMRFINVEFDDEEPVSETIDFYIVEEKPEFPGGQDGLLKFIYENVVFPPVAIDNNIEGTVHLYFIVNEYGYIENIEIVRGVDPLLDQAALEAIQKLPKWKPGKQRGKAVKVRYHVPIKFELKY